MKAGTDKSRKRRETIRTAKPCCGTLCHIAECRGILKKPGTIRWQAELDSPDRMIRRYRVHAARA